MNRTATRNGERPEVLDAAPPSGAIGELAQLPREMALLKMENDSIQSMALAHPRDYEAVKQDVAKQLKAFPSFAREAIYRKPVGKDESGQQKFARGLSVRAAEAVAEAYGFNRVRTSVDEIPGDEDKVRVTATFTDFQKGRIWEDSGILSKFYKPKSGGRIRTPDDRFYSVVCKAEISRRAREVILRSVPPGLRSELFEMAEAAMAALLTPQEVNKLVASFGKLGVSVETIERYLGSKRDGWNQDHRLAMAEIWNAIKDGETTVDEVFAEKPTLSAAQEATMDDLTGDAPAPEEPVHMHTEPEQVPAHEAAAAVEAAAPAFDFDAFALELNGHLAAATDPKSVEGVRKWAVGKVPNTGDYLVRTHTICDARLKVVKGQRGEASNG